MDRENLEELHGVSCCGHHTIVAFEAYHYIKRLEKENQELLEELKKIKQHIKDKIRKSFEYDWGIGGECSDRLFTETVVELQIIERMIDEVLEENNEDS